MNSKDMLSAAGKFPFIMVLTSTFLRGSFFLALNFPVIAELAAGSKFADVVSLLRGTAVSFWQSAVTVLGNVVTIPAFFLGSLIAGILLAPLERLIAYPFSKAALLILQASQKLRCKGSAKLFLGSEFTHPEYVELLSWFLSNPEKKMHWEWELYHYYLYWGVFVNVLAFTILSVVALWQSLSWKSIAVCIAPSAFFLLFAIARSVVMGQVHQYYLQEQRRNAQP